MMTEALTDFVIPLHLAADRTDLVHGVVLWFDTALGNDVMLSTSPMCVVFVGKRARVNFDIFFMWSHKWRLNIYTRSPSAPGGRAECSSHHHPCQADDHALAAVPPFVRDPHRAEQGRCVCVLARPTLCLVNCMQYMASVFICSCGVANRKVLAGERCNCYGNIYYRRSDSSIVGVATRGSTTRVACHILHATT
jgi:hypothetical protein